MDSTKSASKEIKKIGKKSVIPQNAYSTEKSEKLFDPITPRRTREHISVCTLLQT